MAYELAAALLLAELALIMGIAVGKTLADFSFGRTFDQAKTMPLTKPMKIAETLPKVTGALKKMRPLTAIGSLLRAPTIEYVVDDVMRMHHAEQ